MGKVKEWFLNPMGGGSLGASAGGYDPITGRMVFDKMKRTNLNEQYNEWLTEGIIKFGSDSIDLDDPWSASTQVQVAFSVGHITVHRDADSYIITQKARDYLQQK